MMSLAIGLLWAAAAAAAPTIVKIATVAPEGTPWAAGLIEYKKAVEQKTGGRYRVRVFLGGALGDENETVLACKRGQIQSVGASTGAMASQVPELAILELPYLFRSEEEADYVLEKVLLADFEGYFKARGLVLAFWSENGYRSFGTRTAPIKGPADLKGKKMRSQEAPVHIEMYRTFGASPVTLAVTEVLTSLQTGVVDGYDNTPLYAQAASWHTATKYFALTNHIYQPAAVVWNRAFFDKLPPEEQKVLIAEGAAIAPKIRKQIRAMIPLLVDNLSSAGIAVHRPSATEMKEFETLGAEARKRYVKTASKPERALYEKIQKALAGYRSGAR
jgi:tripartite ATP-independent transporter DctP family solute receptor